MNFVAYLTLAIYLQQVLPQDYGVPKHPLFFLSRHLKAISPRLHSHIFDENAEDLGIYRQEDELIGEDADVKEERKFVYRLDKEEYDQYPLVVKDIRKVYPGVNGRQPKIANKNITFRINNGELLGLLGPNGAGKTTLIT